MKKLIALTAIIALSACAQESGRGPGGRPIKLSANPSEVIAAELAFNRLAQEKGQWTAFRESAATGAEMFVPQRVDAAGWLKGRANPSVSVTWQPYAVWSSCDGSYAATTGQWQRPGSSGSYVTIWQRQKDGEYKWLLDQSISTEKQLTAPDMLSAKVATCPERKGSKVALANDGARASDDNTLSWTSNASADGTARLTVRSWDGKEAVAVIETGGLAQAK